MMIYYALAFLAAICIGDLAVSLYLRGTEYHPRNYNPPTLRRREP